MERITNDEKDEAYLKKIKTIVEDPLKNLDSMDIYGFLLKNKKDSE